MTTNYRMVTFKGELVEIAEKFNTWMRQNDSVEVIDIKFAPLTFNTYANQFALAVLYGVEKVASDKCKPVIDRPTPKEPILCKSAEELETLKEISRNMSVISDTVAFGACSRCWNGVRGIEHGMATLKKILSQEKDEEENKTTIEYAGDGNTTWRTEMKEENKND